MQEFDWIFDRDDVSGTRRVDAVDHRCQRRRLSRTSRAGHQDQTAPLFGDLVDHRRQSQRRGAAALIGNHAQHDAHRSALLKNVRAKSAQSVNAVRDVYFRNFLELLFLPVRHHRKRHIEGVFR